MTFELPNLDQRSYQQLVQELLRKIPQFTTQWTDYNDSDPGITLIQLLAWLDESLLYQANNIPVQTQQNYLRWVLGLADSQNKTVYSQFAEKNYDFSFLRLRNVLQQIEAGENLSKQVLQKQVLEYIGSEYAAITLCDIEQLALQTNRVIAQRQESSLSAESKVLHVEKAYAQVEQEVMHVYILDDSKPPYIYPDYSNRILYRNTSSVKRRTMILNTQNFNDAKKDLINQVQRYIEPRVILGTRVVAKPAQFTDINLILDLNLNANTDIQVTLDVLFNSLFNYLLPVNTVAESHRWSYGQAPQADDIRQLIYQTPGIDAINYFNLNFIPTIELDELAQLGVNTRIKDLPPGNPGLFYVGLPRLRCLDITARESKS